MPSVLPGNVAYGTNDPKLVKWIWIGRNCRYLMGMPLDFHAWGDFSNRAVSLVGTLDQACGVVTRACGSCGNEVCKAGQVSPTPRADLISLLCWQLRVLLLGLPERSSCCWPLASGSSPASFCTLGLAVTCVVWPESGGAVEPEKTPAPWVLVWFIKAICYVLFLWC